MNEKLFCQLPSSKYDLKFNFRVHVLNTHGQFLSLRVLRVPGRPLQLLQNTVVMKKMKLTQIPKRRSCLNFLKMQLMEMLVDEMQLIFSNRCLYIELAVDQIFLQIPSKMVFFSNHVLLWVFDGLLRTY